MNYGGGRTTSSTLRISYRSNSGATNEEALQHGLVPTPPPSLKDNTLECHLQGCRFCGAELRSCAAPKCNRFMHLLCYQGMCMQRGIKKPLDGRLVCCIKGCHDRVSKQKENKGGKLNWHNGGKKDQMIHICPCIFCLTGCL